MSNHAFSLDPHLVLGVGPGASPDEIRDAYYAKSKKHHPDVGGDEWAFRLVARAYEVLKATAPSPLSQAWNRAAPHGTAPSEEQRWSWTQRASSSPNDSSTAGWETSHEPAGNRFGARPDERAGGTSGSTACETGECRAVPEALSSVSVELVWTRYERDDAAGLSSLPIAEDATLSVCMVISWPPHSLVDCAAQFPSSGDILHTLIELFGRLRSQGSVVAARSRIEDGRFVAWLSYPDVLTAGDAFVLVRETFQNEGLIPKLQTRDVVLPLDLCNRARRAHS